MTDWNKISAFMASVVAWPGPGEPGYVNLQYSYHDRQSPDGKKNGKWPVSAGKPFREVADLVSRAAWNNTTSQFKDQWFCLSLQSQAKPDPRNAGKLKAVRASANALKLKALWVDIDVKPGQYDTLADALKALFEFVAKVGLPPPSALVASGGGLHVYWISDQGLSVTQWATYAHGLKALLVQEGLKCDAGLTTDQARILRVPGTFNHKSDPPKPVQLLDQPLVMYNFETALEFLTKIAPVPASVPGQRPPHSIFAEGVTAAAFKGGPPAAFQITGEPGLDAGIDKFADQLLPIEPIFKQCAFYRDALRDGGANYDQPLWMLSVLGATFMENGNAVAHAISQGHAAYTKDDTQALYDRKVAERAERGIGYPSCAAIAGSGCAACQTCPLLAKGKSPLNIKAPITAAVTPAPQSAAAQALSLPHGFDVNDKDLICKVIERVLKDGETETILVPLFKTKLSGFWAQKNPDRLNYTVTVDKGYTHMASVPMAEMAKMNFGAYLMSPEARTLIDVDGTRYLGEFYMSMLDKLWKESASQETLPFGWHETGGQIDGFTFGGVTRFEDGSVKPCGVGDVNLQRYYTPAGDLQPWFDAAALVTNRRRPELTAIMLASFAAPLVKISGHNGAIFSAWGDSGSGKSSAFTVGMAVWGHPLTTKGSQNSTYNAITSQMAEVRHLPFYWDEIKDDAHRKKAFDIAHDLTDGVEKARKVSGTKTQERGTWKLPVILASNGSFREFLQKTNHQHSATINRVLEWHVETMNNSPGNIAVGEATQTLAKLESNYGRMGELYAQFLAANHRQIEADYKLLSHEFEVLFKQGTAERFWILAPTLLCLAARYARRLGVDVEEGDIREWVVQVVRENIAQRDEQGMSGKVDTSDEMLSRYIKDRHAEERIIWTNYIHLAQGKPPKAVVLLKGPSQQRNNAGGIEARVAVENREFLIARRDFEEWATTKPNSYSLMQGYAGLKQIGLRMEKRVRLLSGTTFGVDREPVLIITVDGPDHPLWDFLWQYSTPDERKAAEAAAPVQTEPVDTGLTPTQTVVDFVKGAVRDTGQSEAGEVAGADDIGQ